MSRFGSADQIQRFWAKVRVRGPDECWEWTASRCGEYGQVGVDGTVQYAHRVSWCLANKHELDDPLVVRHSCDNPICVNPAHLFNGTQADNLQDCSDKGRIGMGERHYKAKVTDAEVEEIRRLKACGVRAVDLAERYGIGRSQVLRIVQGTTRVRPSADQLIP